MSLRVLVVDDVVPLARNVERVVRGAWPEALVDVAHSLHEARARLRAAAPDVAVLDIDLGDGSGVDLAGELRAAAPGVRVVFMTGDPGSADAARAAKIGAVALLSKPFSPEQLVEAVRDGMDE